MDKYLAIIPNTIQPYGMEFIHILAYPEAFEYRFRFNEKWVEKTLTNNNRLSGKKGYIILREFESGKLIPIRFFKTKSFQKIGKIIYIEVVFDNLVPIDSESKFANDQIDEFNKSFLNFNSSVFSTNPPSGHLRPLVFLTNFSCDIKNEHKGIVEDEELESWGNILERFKDISFFENVQFLRIIGIERFEGSSNSNGFKNGELHLTEGHDYKLKIAQLIPNKSSNNPTKKSDIRLTSDNHTIKILRGIQKAVGTYDILTFIFRVTKEGLTSASFLDLAHVPKQGEESGTEPHLYIPVKIQRLKRKIIYRLAILLFFALLYAGPSLPTIIPISFFTNYSSIIKDLSIIGICLSLFSLFSEIKRKWI